VSVSRDLVEEYADSSQSLSPESLAAWDTYTPTIDLNLVDIEPANVEVADDNTIVDSQPLTDQSPQTDSSDDDNGDSASPVWWFVGIGAVLLLWYVLWRRQDEDIA